MLLSANRKRKPKTSPMHLYIVVDCKTKNCGTAHVLTYLGEKGKTPASVEYWMSYPLMIDCPLCGQTYDYSDSEEEFRQKELQLSPPSEYFNRLAAPGDSNFRLSAYNRYLS
jgi:hypothetical protein